MKNAFLILVVLLMFKSLNAQKVVENPINTSSNIPGKITKVEITSDATILHFWVKYSIGGWMAVPTQTYIEDASKGKRLFVKKAEGIEINKRHTFDSSNALIYKLYFPPINKDVEKINYGEANKGGNWYAYKIDLTNSIKDKTIFNKTVIGHSLYSLQNMQKPFRIGNETVGLSSNSKLGFTTGYPVSSGESLLPEDLPEDFFGNWYDKYGTLMLIATPEFVVSNIRVSYYNEIRKINDNRYSITHSGGHFDILKLDDKKMSLGGERLQTFYKESINNKIPKTLKGTWEYNNDKIVITDDSMHFGGDKNSYIFGSKQLNIVHVAPSKNGDIYWFILYNQGNYYIYIANKIDGEYMLSVNGWQKGRYKKIDK